MATNKLRLFVRNIPWSVTRRELKEYFSNFGHVKNARIIFDDRTGMSRGYGFIQFRTQEGLSTAVHQDTHIINNYKLILAPQSNTRNPINEMEDGNETEDRKQTV